MKDWSMMMVCQDLPAPGRVVDLKLAALRAQYPFLAIQPAPLSVISVSLINLVERTVQFPDSTQMVRFTYTPPAASFADLWISFQGKAQVVPGGGAQLAGSLVNPDGWYYVAEMRQVSLIAAGALDVSIHCHIQQ